MGLFTSSLSVDLLCIVATLCGVIYFYAQYWLTYWDRRGIKSLKPSFPFGNFGNSFTLKQSIGELLQDVYNATDEPFIGIYGSLRPIFVPRDPELIRRIMIKDFNYFPNRGVYFDEKNDPLSAHLFAIEDQKWKTLRSKLSPTFTSGKLKAMFPTLVKCGTILNAFLEKKAADNESFEVRELSASHSTNVIASVAFGIDVNCIKNPDTEFRYYGRKPFAQTLKNAMRGLCSFISPKLMKYTGLRAVDADVEEFILTMVKKNLELREQSNVTRKDFFQLLVQLRNGVDISADDQWKATPRADGKFEFTIEEVAAQAFVFFLAGYETSSTTLSWCLYELAKRPEIQRRIHEEIDEVLARHDGEITYDALNEMKYLDMCIDGELLFSLRPRFPGPNYKYFVFNYRNAANVSGGSSSESRC